MDYDPPTPPASSITSDSQRQPDKQEMLSPLSTTSNARQDKVFRKPPQLTPEQRDAILHEPSGQASYDESDDDDNNPYKPAYHHRKAPASRTAKLRVQDRQSQSSPKSSPKKRRSKHSSSDIQRFGASDAITQGRKRKAPGKELDYNATTRRHDAINQKFLAAGEVIDIAKADFNRACQVFGGRAVQSKKDDEDGDLKWHVRGMSERSYLPDHELLGAAFMRKREFASTAPSGGILADEMGLGKTIQQLVNILGSNLHYGKKGMTLIVAPSIAVRKQWFEEIKTHFQSSALGSVLEYASNKHISTDMIKMLLRHHIILTTYNEVINSFGDRKTIKGDPRGDDRQKAQHLKSLQAFENNQGPLHKVTFDRIVLDEGHNIKTHNIVRTTACMALKGRHRWLITGSPFINNAIDEAFSYFRFLQMPGVEKLGPFRKQYSTPVGLEQLRDILTSIMLRRTHDTQVLGKPILNLPTSTRDIIHVKATGPEAEISGAMHADMRDKVLEIVKQSMGEQEREAKVMAAMAPVRLISSHFLAAAHVLPEYADRELLSELYGASALEPDKMTSSKMNKMIHYVGMVFQHAQQNAQVEEIFRKANPKSVAQDWEDEEGFNEPPPKPKAKLPWDKTEARFNMKKFMAKGGQLMHSAKSRAAIAKIEEWLEQYPGEKIIGFGLFLGGLNMVASLCKARGIGSRHYTGQESVELKEKYRKEWATNASIQVLLTTFRSGGEGLNLTEASSVLIMDLWWNVAAENQAFGRVYRMGQKKETRLARIVLQDSLDERLLSKQAAKSRKIDALLDKSEKAPHNWTSRELAELAGITAEDFEPDY